MIGLIHDIPTCDELVKRIEREAIETLQKASSLLVEEDNTSEKPIAQDGKVGKNINNPEAELWGIGKSKL